MASNTIIPSIDARGRFEAEAPFDAVVKPEVYYTVEAIRNIHEMEALKLDLYELVFKPVGITVDGFPAALEAARKKGAKVLSLLDRADVATYVLTNYLKSWPLVDGISYEHMVIIADMGPVPPIMADILAKEIEHIKNHIEANVGITTTVTIGTIPTIGYVSKEQADAYENVRKSKITENGNDVARIRDLEAKSIRDDAYIAQLEAALAARPQP